MRDETTNRSAQFHPGYPPQGSDDSLQSQMQPDRDCHDYVGGGMSRGHRYQAPPFQETVYINNDAGNDTPITRMTVPLLLVLSGGLIVGILSWSMSGQFSDIKAKLERMDERIQSLTSGLKNRIERIEVEMEHRTKDRYSLGDHNAWCATTEAINIQNGWRCGPVTTKGYGDTANPRLQMAPRLRGWEEAK